MGAVKCRIGKTFFLAYYSPNLFDRWTDYIWKMNFTIPKTTPPGKYLMRVEELYYQEAWFNFTQIYISCTHVEIKGPGGGMRFHVSWHSVRYSHLQVLQVQWSASLEHTTVGIDVRSM